MVKSNSYASQVSGAQTMSTALKANITALSKRGMTEEFISSFDQSLNNAMRLNSEQERLKGELKLVTSALDTVRKELHAKMSESVKVVKLEMQKERWIEFGITGKR